MSTPSGNSVGGTRQVTCETSNMELVAVELEVLRCSHAFSKMYDDLGQEERNEFEGVFPVRGISSKVFKKVIAWCKAHKELPEPVIEKDAFTQEVKWLAFTPYERQFLDVPVPSLLELITAAKLLGIPSLYHCACQAVAALPFLRLPAIWQCKVLEIGYGIVGLEAREILKWLEGGPSKQLTIARHAIVGDYSVLVESLKTAFMNTDRPRPYKVVICYVRPRQRSQYLWNEKTKEQLDVRMEGDDDLIVERK
ncbi:hypothetical protein AAVH_30398 [Aphelenchoides avenae]|nr:hypothetical protein AAVH_30398 [Aphelenchus avenae]